MRLLWQGDVDTPSSTGASPVSQETQPKGLRPADITQRNQAREPLAAPPALKPAALDPDRTEPLPLARRDTPVRSKLSKRIVVVAGMFAIGVAASFVTASSAFAKGEYKYWNSSSNPLVVTGYGSTARAYGQWRIADGSAGTRSYHDARMTYVNADNHTKYSKMETWTNSGICIAPQYTSCTASYYFYASAGTRHSNALGWEWLYANTGLSSSGNYARDAAYACLDIPWRPDPCSGPTLTSGSAY